MARVVMVTDCRDVAFSEICGAIHKEADEIGHPITIEPIVAVENFSEFNAAFLTRLVAESYPPGTVIYTLVSKSSNMRPLHDVIWGETRTGHIFVGSNFGYFGWLARDLGIKHVYEIRDVPQKSFSGKDFIPPIVARIAADDTASLTAHPYEESKIDDTPFVEGTVAHVDNFGNVKIMTEIDELPHGQTLALALNGTALCEAVHITNQIYLQPELGKIVAYRSTSFPDMTDIGMVRGNFAESHGIRVGDRLTWTIESPDKD
ncbi:MULTISPECIES: SAM-dependent chlorinase/fluorinase [unclassified Streptomyces]|uniref:SAM-dependent chlorinase/fluorinase n=1 Tax=unclassified Streptomyces TaxID=2593676 RepID=UPI002E292795|nr:SAM-dependent chlorinase/fluorinase [Streptomyces sp. NBC_00252]